MLTDIEKLQRRLVAQQKVIELVKDWVENGDGIYRYYGEELTWDEMKDYYKIDIHALLADIEKFADC